MDCAAPPAADAPHSDVGRPAHSVPAPSLHHYKVQRDSARLLPFWSGRGLAPQDEANFSEILTRADALVDGLEMLLPQESPTQRRLVREAIQDVERAMSLALGAFTLEERGR